jgi:hypothetical protein
MPGGLCVPVAASSDGWIPILSASVNMIFAALTTILFIIPIRSAQQKSDGAGYSKVIERTAGLAIFATLSTAVAAICLVVAFEYSSVADLFYMGYIAALEVNLDLAVNLWCTHLMTFKWMPKTIQNSFGVSVSDDVQSHQDSKLVTAG